jgi:hypothetical protein
MIVAGGVAGNIEKATRDLDDQEKAEVQSLGETSKGIAKLTQDADKVLGGPELQGAVAGLAVTAKNLGEVTGNAAKLSDFYYKKLTSPVSLALKVGEGVGHYAALFAGALVGTWH